jgi:hypothetical protein
MATWGQQPWKSALVGILADLAKAVRGVNGEPRTTLVYLTAAGDVTIACSPREYRALRMPEDAIAGLLVVGSRAVHEIRPAAWGAPVPDWLRG